MTRDPWAAAADYLDPPLTGAAVYHDHPDRFVKECFVWERDDDGPTKYQLDNLRLLVKHKRLAVRGPHGLGKTTQSAWALLWFALTRDAKGEDWKVITTASAWRQLTDFLWPEIRKWARKINWEAVGREPFDRTEMMQRSLKMKFGTASAVACEDPATIEGAHADQLFYIYDESKTIPPGTFDASEGAFSGAEANAKQEAYALASSTPGDPEGRFYDIHRRAPGLLNWHAVHVTLEDTLKAKRNGPKWVEDCRQLWGTTSAVFIRRVLGEFAQSEETGVIPLAHLELANERWLKLQSEGALDKLDVVELTCLGVDVARSGEDKTVFAERYEHTIKELHRFTRQDTMETANRVAAKLNAAYHPAKGPLAVIDVIGLGAGVVDRVAEQSQARVTAFNASEATTRKDMFNELGFTNKRAAAYWYLREMLDPANKLDVALPPDDTLTGDLCAPQWRVMAGGKIQVELKDDIKKRINRSTDDGDAVVMAFWPEGGENMSDFAGNENASFFASAPERSRWNYE